MKYQEPNPEDYQEIAEKVRSGEYFREARAMYDISVNDPLSERYFYLSVTLVSFLVFLVSFYALNALYPLKHSVPFSVESSNMVDDFPRILPLRSSANQTPSEAVLNYLVSNYVILYEQYAIQNINRNGSGVRSQSSAEVLQQYKNKLDTSNPESPARLYERHSVKNIFVQTVAPVYGNANEVEVVFDAVVTGQGGEEKKSRYKANVTFDYSGVELDEKSGKVKPLEFLVTGYQVKQIQGD